MADRSPLDLTEPHWRVLIAVVEGYRAREGLKDRIRALNEWEIARRAGATMLSYAEYMRDSSRDGLIAVLAQLERLGLVSTWERGANYDTFVPTDRGGAAVDSSDAEESTARPAERSASESVSATADPVIERLDEIIRVLHSIETRLSDPR